MGPCVRGEESLLRVTQAATGRCAAGLAPPCPAAALPSHSSESPPVLPECALLCVTRAACRERPGPRAALRCPYPGPCSAPLLGPRIGGTLCSRDRFSQP